MTREEARKAAEVMLAYADGKEIESSIIGEDEFNLCMGNTGFNFTCNEYRIKQGPTYRPFANKEECWAEMQKHQPFGWIKYNEVYLNIVYVDDKDISYLSDNDLENLDYIAPAKYMKFADGTPFGIREE